MNTVGADGSAKMFKRQSNLKEENPMKSYLISIILSAVLAAYPVIGSAAGGAFTGSKSSSASLNALTKTSSKLERRKRISGCFKRAMRNGDIPGTTDRIGLKKIVCSGGSHLIVATIPVVSLGEPEAQEHFEEAMNELSWRSPKMDQQFGLLVDLVGDDFYAAYDASFFLDSCYWPITLVSSSGRAEFDALFGMEPEDFAHVVQSLADPQVFYSAGGTILKWTAAGGGLGAG